MTHSHLGRKQKQIERQGGVSPLSGRSLEGENLQRAHIIPRRNGGRETIIVPDYEHALMHVMDSRKKKSSREERRMDANSAKSIVRGLTPEKISVLNQEIVRRTFGKK